MATADASAALEIQRFPLSNYVDAVRFIPAVSALDRLIAAAVHDPESASLNLYSLHHDLLPISSFPLPSPVSSLSLSSSPHHPALAAAATRSGALHLLTLHPSSASHRSVSDGAFHAGAIPAVDVQASGGACVTVGDDGRVNLVRVGESRVSYERIGDGRGLREFTAVRWGSEWEFATGGLGFGVQWWDHRKPGGIVSQFKGFGWSQGAKSGLVHSIDVHPSRKHTCVVGGSSGTVFAWDLRWQGQPIMLSGCGANGSTPSLSEVWKVQYDNYVQIPKAGSAKVQPVLMCSEDGILALLEQGEEPIEILAELCAINSFDIDPQNPSDIICSLEWESIVLLKRK